jgi:hypothetical protein
MKAVMDQARYAQLVVSVSFAHQIIEVKITSAINANLYTSKKMLGGQH